MSGIGNVTVLKKDSLGKRELQLIEDSLERLARESRHLDAHSSEVADRMPKLLAQVAAISTNIKGSMPLSWMYYLLARTAFKSDAELAQELGVNRSSVTRWKQGRPPKGVNSDILRDLNIVISLLLGYLEPEVIPDWLNGLSPMLDNRRPIDVLRAGHLSDVVAAIEAEKSGAFA